MSFLDRFIDTEKTAKVEVRSPRDIYYDILKGASGTSFTREMNVDLFYTVYGFKGITDGIGCSTLVANVAQAIADMGLTVCVIDTSILSPVQDILLRTDVEYEVSNTYEDKVAEGRLDWFDMPYTRKSVLHISKLNPNISVLSFKGKLHTVVDLLSTNDSDTLVEMALSELHTKFDLILIDICHETTSVATACLQQAQKIIQIWNDSPVVLGNLERFLTNSVLLACPLDKMSNVVYSKVHRDAMGTLDNILKEYKFDNIGTNYLSDEIALQAVIGSNLFQLPSKDKNVIAYTDCVVDVACTILNLTEEREEAKREQKKKKGIISTEDILNGKVEGTVTKKLKDRETDINKNIGITPVKTLEDADKSLNEDGFVDVYKDEGLFTDVNEFENSFEVQNEPEDLNVNNEIGNNEETIEEDNTSDIGADFIPNDTDEHSVDEFVPEDDIINEEITEDVKPISEEENTISDENGQLDLSESGSDESEFINEEETTSEEVDEFINDESEFVNEEENISEEVDEFIDEALDEFIPEEENTSGEVVEPINEEVDEFTSDEDITEDSDEFTGEDFLPVEEEADGFENVEFDNNTLEDNIEDMNTEPSALSDDEFLVDEEFEQVDAIENNDNTQPAENQVETDNGYSSDEFIPEDDLDSYMEPEEIGDQEFIEEPELTEVGNTEIDDNSLQGTTSDDNEELLDDDFEEVDDDDFIDDDSLEPMDKFVKSQNTVVE